MINFICTNINPIISSFYGGLDEDCTAYIAVDSSNRIILGGVTNTIDIIPVNAFQHSKNSVGWDTDAFICCVDLNLAVPPPEPVDYSPYILTMYVVLPPALAMIVMVLLRARMKKVDSYRYND